MSNVQHIILATRNTHKTREFRKLLAPDFVVTDLSARPEVPAIIETGESFAENAILKSIGVSQRLPGLVIADDSGLEVDALNGGPGIYSARYAGEDATDRQNIGKLLNELRRRNVPAYARSARFRCVVVLAREGRLVGEFTGMVKGKIVDPPRGNGGFGYDSTFQPDGFHITFAEMADETKNCISHRAQAAEQLRQFFKTGCSQEKM
jgi:XTP/dITP diphosphohydrolase